MKRGCERKREEKENVRMAMENGEIIIIFFFFTEGDVWAKERRISGK